MIQKLFITAFLCAFTLSGFAKKVKFAVDMSQQTVDPNGVHIIGTFLHLYGASDETDPTFMQLNQEGSTAIYSKVLDMPAHHEYEFKFVNGNLSYFIEFVPVESRVNYNNNDNRWFYLDSLATDTTLIGIIPFAGNAPYGKNLLRLVVDMSNTTINTDSVHVAGSFNNFSTVKAHMYSFDAINYEYIAFVDSNVHTYSYKFINGKNSSGYESVPSACATGGNRTTTVSGDIMLDAVCFSSCTTCVAGNGIAKISAVKNATIYPNPASGFVSVRFNDNASSHIIKLLDISGRILKTITSPNASATINTEELNEGIYFISISGSGKTSVEKLIKQ